MSIITLLTDFGTKDHYVASMKGVILTINPRATLVDITHQVPPHEIEEGAFILANAYSSFPRGTIHLAVVDPGVGSQRNPILLVTGNYFFLGPDNGLFTFIAQREKIRNAMTITNPKYFLSKVSNTFHGRDLFAPVAGHLSLGVRPESFGKRIDSWVRLSIPVPEVDGTCLTGQVVHIDSFGNLISNIDEKTLLDFCLNRPIMVRIGHKTVRTIKRSYWEGRKREPIALVGSGGFLEISVREGNAQRVLKAKKGDQVKVQIQ
jgi:hypothetical protein